MKKYELIKPIFHEFFKPTDPGRILHETDETDIYEYVSQYGNSKTPDSKIKLTPEELADKTVEIIEEEKHSISLTDVLWRELKEKYFQIAYGWSSDRGQIDEAWQDYQMKLIKESQE